MSYTTTRINPVSNDKFILFLIVESYVWHVVLSDKLLMSLKLS